MNSLTRNSIIACLLTVSMSIYAFGQPASQQTGTAPEASTAEENQSTSERKREAVLAMAMAPIKSPSDLRAYAASNTASNPLDALTPLNRELFEQGLTFNEKGITGFRYDSLETLTASQAYAILSLFGVQHFTPSLKNVRIVTATDRLIMDSDVEPAEVVNRMRCEGVGTCRSDNTAACTSNC